MSLRLQTLGASVHHTTRRPSCLGLTQTRLATAAVTRSISKTPLRQRVSVQNFSVPHVLHEHALPVPLVFIAFRAPPQLTTVVGPDTRVGRCRTGRRRRGGACGAVGARLSVIRAQQRAIGACSRHFLFDAGWRQACGVLGGSGRDECSASEALYVCIPRPPGKYWNPSPSSFLATPSGPYHLTKEHLSLYAKHAYLCTSSRPRLTGSRRSRCTAL